MPDLAELGRFIPALRRHTPDEAPIQDEPEVDRYRLFAAVTRLLAFVAREHSVVLILDDLQWADASTVLLLAHMLQDPDPVKLLVVATMRDSEELGDELLDLLARLRRQPSMERIALAGLDAEETEALVLAREGTRHQRRDDPTSACGHRRQPVLHRGDAARAAELGVPEGVKVMISRRLARLDELTVQVVTAASVVGREFRLEVLEALIDAAGGAAHLRPGGGDRRRADPRGRGRRGPLRVRARAGAGGAVRAQSAARRVRAHYAIAQALEGLAPRFALPPAELAHHYSESRHLDRDRARRSTTPSPRPSRPRPRSRGSRRPGTTGRAPGGRRARRAPLRAAARAGQRRVAVRASRGAGHVRARRRCWPGAPSARRRWRGRRWASPAATPRPGIVDRDGIALLEEALAPSTRPAPTPGRIARWAMLLSETSPQGEASPRRARARAAGRLAALRGRAGAHLRAQQGGAGDGAADRRPRGARGRAAEPARGAAAHLAPGRAARARRGDPRAGRAGRGARARGARAPLAHLRPARGRVDRGGARRARRAGAARRAAAPAALPALRARVGRSCGRR